MCPASENAQFDAIGVGVGPFNLSAAALCQRVPGLRTLFLDRAERFSWHPGLLISGSTIQVSHLKDLVTLADPTSPYSFLNYLHEKERMYRFIAAGFKQVQRAEFEDYFRWVSERVDNVRFGTPVSTIEFDRGRFVINGDAELAARNLILGTGLVPTVPECAKPHIGSRVMHAHELLFRLSDWTGLRVAVVGGGQSGAEVLKLLLNDPKQMPRAVSWITSRPNFLPLDDSPFTNELFTPHYSNYFFDLPEDRRMFMLESQKLASDGISMALLEELYRTLYSFEFVSNVRPEISLRAERRVVNMSARSDGSFELELLHRPSGDRTSANSDVVVLCTGYHYEMPTCLEKLKARIPYSKAGYRYRRDFSIEWDGPQECKIYVQNAAINARGVADPNLSLMAWRSANIVNDIAGRPVYRVQSSKDLRLWQ
jgi:lysine N6-hydroxylase